MRENGEMFIAGVDLKVEVRFKLHLKASYLLIL